MTNTPIQMPDKIYGKIFRRKAVFREKPYLYDGAQIEYIRADLVNASAESVPSDKEGGDIVDKAYIFLCNKLNDYQAKDSSRPASFYTDLKPSMLWAVEYLAKEGYIKTAPDQSCHNDYVPHHEAWKNACIIAKSSSTSQENKLYWQHQIDTLDRLKEKQALALAQLDNADERH